ncbi:MAG: alpha/beta-hydrolase family protein, partial [Dehalococcoidia bacterium]
VHWRRMGREGRRHVLTALPASVIAEVMEEAARADPIRVYVGLESAKTELERVSLAIRELERTGAFDRALLIAVSPTGTGYVNYAAIECCEYFTLGNCATVTLQYSKRPSPMSLDRVWEGRKQFRMLLAAMRRELYKRDPEHRPRLVVFGESLGAHTSQDAFLHEGTQGLEDAGIDRALWIGSPHLSKWKAQVLGEPRADVDRSLLMDVNDFGEIEALSETERRKLRYIMITHHNDGVGLFGADLAIQKPPWLGDPELRPPTVPKWMRWAPIVTSIQTVIDMKNAMNVVPGVFVANGHDYRADLARFVREVYDLPATDLQLARVEAALREYELLRQKLIEGTEAPAKTSAGDDFRDEIAA